MSFRSINQLVFVRGCNVFFVILRTEILNVVQMALRRAKQRSKFNATVYKKRSVELTVWTYKMCMGAKYKLPVRRSSENV